MNYENLEKLLTGIMFSLGCVVVYFVYVRNGQASETMTVFVLGIGGLFVARKVAKYSLQKQLSSNAPPVEKER